MVSLHTGTQLCSCELSLCSVGDVSERRRVYDMHLHKYFDFVKLAYMFWFFVLVGSGETVK